MGRPQRPDPNGLMSSTHGLAPHGVQASKALRAPQQAEGGVPKAIAKVEGRGASGHEVWLRGSKSKGADLRHRWIQVRGPAVQLDGSTDVDARFTVPNGAGPLGFLLVVSGPEGSDTVEVSVPIEGTPLASEESMLRADAGDDQIGLVGRQVTLNGSRSEPRGRVGFRWIQTGGPAVRFKLEEGYIHSFVPTVPGVYRFALAVASHSTISAPDEVVVRVGTGVVDGKGGGESDPITSSKVRPVIPTQELARAGLAAIRGGADAAEPLAKVFEDTANRMGVYQTYGEAFSEMSRRFEEILPEDPVKRQRWVDRVFQPLTARTLEVMRLEGLELLRADGPEVALDDAQKAALAEQFHLIAEGLRSVAQPQLK
ncbi:hypothetical protein Sinac_1608 [Singulisphaera acidiphila DSM 18658]|uniref:Uncharacterized protein n=2 Tax=Singulisphaera acidiphila TaxID=466153 RepID=L0D9R9_SINAD|nr:hypothetical protein Sinac_1608 [Singulisphaera acidiphila DSM 18658]